MLVLSDRAVLYACLNDKSKIGIIRGVEHKTDGDKRDTEQVVLRGAGLAGSFDAYYARVWVRHDIRVYDMNMGSAFKFDEAFAVLHSQSQTCSKSSRVRPYELLKTGSGASRCSSRVTAVLC